MAKNGAVTWRSPFQVAVLLKPVFSQAIYSIERRFDLLSAGEFGNIRARRSIADKRFFNLDALNGQLSE